MSAKKWIFGTFGAVALAVGGALTVETIKVAASDEVKDALKVNNSQPESALKTFWDESVKMGSAYFQSIVTPPDPAVEEAERYRTRARLFVTTLPNSENWSPKTRSIAKEELARDMMAIHILREGEGPLLVRLNNGFEAISNGTMPEPSHRPGLTTIQGLWKKWNDQPSNSPLR